MTATTAPLCWRCDRPYTGPEPTCPDCTAALEAAHLASGKPAIADVLASIAADVLERRAREGTAA